MSKTIYYIDGGDGHDEFHNERADAGNGAKAIVLGTGRRVDLYECHLLGTMEPVDEPVRFVAAEGADTGPRPFRQEAEKPKRGRPPKVADPNHIPEQAEPKAVVDDPSPFEELMKDAPPRIVVTEPTTGAVAIGDWLCPDCGAGCFASQRVCLCGTARPEFAKAAIPADPAQHEYAPNEALQAAEDGTPETVEALAARQRKEAQAIVSHRVGNDDTECRRCKGPVGAALVNGFRIMICQKEGCHADKETLSTYDSIYGDPLACEPELPKFSAPKVGTSNLPAAGAENIGTGVASALEKRAEILDGFDGNMPIPGEGAVTTQGMFLGRLLDLPPTEWGEEAITEDGGDSGGGQLKALNTVLTETGYGGELRHKACVSILGQIRELASLKDLTKAEAHIIISWLDKAGPEDLAELSKVAGPQRVRI